MQGLTGRKGRPSVCGAELLPLLGIQSWLLSFSPFLSCPLGAPQAEKISIFPLGEVCPGPAALAASKTGLLPNFKRTDRTPVREVSPTKSDYCLDFRSLGGPQVSEKQVLRASVMKPERKQPNS